MNKVRQVSLIDQPDNSVVLQGSGGEGRLIRNLRVANSTLLIAQLLRGEAVGGISHVAMGSGLGSGTLILPEAPLANAVKLRQEVIRVAVNGVSYNDLGNTRGDTITDGTRTNRLLVSATFPGASSGFLLTEAGLFGGSGASSADGGTLMAMITFPPIDNRTTLADQQITWVLSFPLANVET